MNRKGRKNKSGALITVYIVLLLAFTTYVGFDTFVISRVYGDEINTAGSTEQQAAEDSISSEGDVYLSDQGQAASDNSNGWPDSDSNESSSDNSSHSGPGGLPPSGHSGHGRPGDGSHSGRHDRADSGDSYGSSENSGSSLDSSSGSTVLASGTYSDDNIRITVNEYRQNDSNIYVADIVVRSPEYLKTALAQGAFGKNVTEKTSEIANSVNAILAINGDYYGAQERGYVIRNGVLYRDTAVNGTEDLVIYQDGSFGIITEGSVTAEQLVANGAVQTLSFGPALVQNGSIAVGEYEEVGKAMASNPRTAIGIISNCHYVFVVTDGRTSESEGLSLYELAQVMQSLGVQTAYNLDGGGSSTMYFKGQVINNPTTGGRNTRERSVSDIVYIGY